MLTADASAPGGAPRSRPPARLTLPIERNLTVSQHPKRNSVNSSIAKYSAIGHLELDPDGTSVLRSNHYKQMLASKGADCLMPRGVASCG